MPHNHRRLAVQLAAQLPENKEDAVKTVTYLRWLVDGFLYGPQLALVPPGDAKAQGDSSLAETFFGPSGDIPAEPLK